ncbi:peptidase inhibitor family I36 protein [Nocardiopsis sp. FIRDI 009]|uniref:peptidase inhibitor family I36 protein n=1 Tax=Nocardiopsis sp. FIRDI 009 TaxID=714197 RepID=UPI000E2391EB|nr:peptidase inhibitor family I36 protein [Nocardiopsis sp. FIRDI 009]
MMVGALRKLVSGLAVAVAAVSATAAPAASAESAQPTCPRVLGTLCAFTETDGQGSFRLLVKGKGVIEPPVRSAVNHDSVPWCVFGERRFDGERVQLDSFEYDADFGFDAFSARRGRC